MKWPSFVALVLCISGGTLTLVQLSRRWTTPSSWAHTFKSRYPIVAGLAMEKGVEEVVTMTTIIVEVETETMTDGMRGAVDMTTDTIATTTDMIVIVIATDIHPTTITTGGVETVTMVIVIVTVTTVMTVTVVEEVKGMIVITITTPHLQEGPGHQSTLTVVMITEIMIMAVADTAEVIVKGFKVLHT